MGITLILALALILAVTTLIFGLVKKDKRLKIIGAISTSIVIIFVIFLIILIGNM